MLSTARNMGFSSQWELILCALEGALGGFLGALFNRLHASLQIRRGVVYKKTFATHRKGHLARAGTVLRRCCGRLRVVLSARLSGMPVPPVNDPQNDRVMGLPTQIKTVETDCSIWRTRLMKLIEVMIISVVTSLITFGLPYIGARAGWACQKEIRPYVSSAAMTSSVTPSNDGWEHKTLQFYCTGSNDTSVRYYNDMATIFLTTRENSILQIIEAPHRFTYTSLFIITVTFFFLTLISFGASFPAGVFMPTIIMGVTLGAIFGKLVKDGSCVLSCFVSPTCECLHPDEKSPIRRSGPYALLGAVAMLGGIQRSSLSLVVIIIEGTGKVDYLLPIIITTVCAKWVGDRFNQGLYHTTLELKGVPFLGRLEDLENSRVYTSETTAADIMSSDVVCLHECETVERILTVLAKHSYHGFPIISHASTSKLGKPIFRGMILRHQLRVLLARKHFYTLYANPANPEDLLGQLRLVNTQQDASIERLSRGPPPRASRGQLQSTDSDERDETAATIRRCEDASSIANLGQAQTAAPKPVTGVAVTSLDGDERAKIHADMVSSAYECDGEETRLMQASIESLSNAELSLYLNLDEAMNAVPIHVKATCPLERVHNLFRGLSMRHLVVTDDYNCIVGIITRENLIQAIHHAPEFDHSEVEILSERLSTGTSSSYQEKLTEDEKEELLQAGVL